MKTLLIGAGGHNLKADDVDWAVNGLAEALSGLVKSLGGDKVILMGVEITPPGSYPGSISYTAGWIYFNDEIFAVDAGSTAVANLAAFGFNVSDTTDASGDQTYENSTSGHPYRIRKAVGASGGVVSYSDFERLKNKRVLLAIPSLGSGWSSGVGSAPIFSTNAISAFMFTDFNGDTRFRGMLTKSGFTGANGETMFTIASDRRPPHTQAFTCTVYYGTLHTKLVAEIQVQDNGAVVVKILNNTTGDTTGEITVPLDQIVIPKYRI